MAVFTSPGQALGTEGRAVNICGGDSGELPFLCWERGLRMGGGRELKLCSFLC